MKKSSGGFIKLFMKKKIYLFVNPDFDQKYMGGISRLYRIFCKEYNFGLEIIDDGFLKNNKPQKNDKELLVVAGGDGTLHRVINTIPEEFFNSYKFGIIPGGTANEFAKSLNLNGTPEDAASLIATYCEKSPFKHKIAIAGGKHKFLTGLLYGVVCRVLQSTSKSSKTLWGSFAYNLPAFISLPSFSEYIQNFRFNSTEFRTGYLIINNAGLISKDLSDEDIQNEDSEMFSVIYLSADITTSDMIRLLAKNQARMSIFNDSSVFHSQEKEINLNFDKKSLFMLDGETYDFSSPLNIRHHEKYINIICP